MARVLVFHHALGLTRGVVRFADRIRAAGHEVSTPDLYDGELFDTIEEGVGHAETIGFETIAERGAAVAADLDGEIWTVGFSLGVLPAQKAAQTRSDVAGTVLCHSAVPPEFFGSGWPAGVRVQIHLCEEDPFALEDMEAAREIEAAGGELYLYPGAAHLVTDDGHADHDPDIAAVILQRTLDFIAR